MKLKYFCILAILFIVNIKSFAQNELPNLRGVDAVNELKKQGLYNSLKDAAQNATNATAAAGTAFAEQAKIFASDGATTDNFSDSVAISGDTAIVGALYADDTQSNQGAAYIFVRNGGNWVQQAKLVANDANGADAFGYSVGISGDTAVVGCEFCDVDPNANDNRGAAYIFNRVGTTWTQTTKLFEPNGGANTNQFGYSVAINYDTLVVGNHFQFASPFKDTVYVFVRSNSSWTQQAALQPSDSASNDLFGKSLAIDGNTIVVGCFFCDVNAANNDNVGAAYVFKRTGTTWAQQAKLLPDTFNGGDGFGYSVSICSDTIVVGAIYKDASATVNDNQGAAYVFTRSANAWTQQQKLVASDAANNNEFGVAVGVSGNTIVVGAHFAQIGANINQGAAYLYTRSGAVWTQQRKIFDPQGLSSTDFGTTAAISNGTAIVGSIFDTVNGNQSQGSAYIFKALADTWVSQRNISSDGATDDRFGFRVSISGDTAIVGAYNHDQTTNGNQGEAYIFVRNSAGGWTEQAKLTANDALANDLFGSSVDVDGDTAVVGARTSNITKGAAYVFTRTGTTWAQQAKLVASDGAANDNFGVSIAVNSDTAIVGANLADNTALIANSGAAYIFVRSGTTWAQQSKLTVTGGMANDNFGTSVDVSGNSAIIGAPNVANTTVTNQGKAYIYTRSTTAEMTTWMSEANFTSTDGAANDKFGTSVALQNDTAVIGAPFAALTAKTNAGAGYIFNRTTGTTGATWAQTQKLTATDSAANDNFGTSVGIDNKAIIIGSPLADVSAKTDQGAVYVFTFDNTTWTQLSKLLGNDSLANDHFGSSAAISGATVLAGADNKTINTATTQGAVYFIENYSNVAAPNECSTLTPTAAGADLSGFIKDVNNRGLSRIVVQLIMQTGETRTTTTNFRGEFIFKNLPTNQLYFVKPIAKRYNVAPAIQTLNLLSDDASLNFVGYK